MRARLGPQAPSKNRPCTTATPASHPRPSASPVSQGHATHQSVLRVGRDPLNAAPPGSISKRLDDMLSTPFSSRIINYEPPQGFIVPKFSTYDGSSDPFDHIMHYRQLMTIDIGNDMLLCKVFPTSLQGQVLSWLHRLPMNSVDNFRDLSEVFVGQHLCSTRHKQNISTLQNIKMQENETLREFVKRFGQVVLQVESYNMDVVLQIFKRSICPGTPFFESLAKKLPTTMDDLFRRANKYSMLEDDVRATTQQVLVAGQATRNDTTRNFKPSSQQGPSNRGQVERRPRITLTPLTLTYEKLLPVVRKLPGFRWPGPIRSNPMKRNRSKKCAYHKDHGHTAEACRSLHLLVENLLKEGHLKQYVRAATKSGEPSRDHGLRGPIAPVRAIINYIHGGPLDEEYNSKRKRQILLRAATIQEHKSSIRPGLTSGSVHPINGPIVFPDIRDWGLRCEKDTSRSG